MKEFFERLFRKEERDNFPVDVDDDAPPAMSETKLALYAALVIGAILFVRR